MRRFIFFLLCFLSFGLAGKEPYLILSIDGGGIKGIIPATVLTLLEQEIGCRTGQLFDCIGGTSTGGILAVGLAKADPAQPDFPEHRAKEMLDIYLNRNDEIFYRPFLYKLQSLWGLLAPKYSNAKLKNILQEELKFATLGNSVCDLVIPAYDLTTHAGFYFEYFKNQDKEPHNFSFLDIVLATTAAPTYFPSVAVADSFSPHFTHNLVDGGIIANNPAALIWIKCRQNAALQDREVYILSLGTGTAPEDSVSYYESKDWGLFEYLNPLIDNFLDASTSLVEENLKTLEKLKLLHFFRVNVAIPETAAAMDNVSCENVALLHEMGKKCYRQNFILSAKGRKFLQLLKDRAGRFKKTS